MGEDGRTDWSDDRIAENIAPLRALPAEVARQAVRLDKAEERQGALANDLGHVEDAVHEGDRRLHERADREAKANADARSADQKTLSDVRAELLLQLADRDREYRRNLVLAVAPLMVVAIAIVAKVFLGVDLPGTP